MGLVLVFHLWPSVLAGGYIGVDMFFVISGYLITKHLVAELERSGGACVTTFWARRARRLLPSALLVLFVSAGATFAWVPPSLWKQFFRELLASSLYVQNWALARDSVDYLAATNLPSPAQHFWTLSVEEQFYFGLPVLMLSVLGITRAASPASRRSALRAFVASVTVASFAYSLWCTAAQPEVAYFSTFTRAWEFGAGALLSFGVRRASPRACQLAAWGGLLVSGAAAAFYDHSTPFPGIAAAVPVLGAWSIIWAGDSGGRLELASLSRWRPVQLIGDISYSIYLWHWPLIVLVPLGLGRDLGGLDKLAIAAASILLAWASTRWVEAPIRFSSAHAGLRPRAVATWSVAGMGFIVGLALLGLMRVNAAERASASLVAELEARQLPCFGAAAMQAGVACEGGALPGALVPDPATVAEDFVNRPDCRVTGSTSEVHMCALGPPTGYVKRLAALGDSHSVALLPAYEVIAAEMNWRIDVAAKNACYWTSGVQRNPNPHLVAACERWKASLNQKLMRDEPYEAILVTHSVSIAQPAAAPGGDPQDAIVQGLLEAWSPQTRRGTKIIAIRDNPVATDTTTTCVARHLWLANQRCSLPRAQALGTFDGQIPATRLLPGAHLVDLSRYYCDADTCPTIIGNVVVYRDQNHLTVTYARTLAPFLLAEIQKILD